MELLIYEFYEQQKKNSNIKLGINRFSKAKKTIAIILLIMLLVCLVLTGILLFALSNTFWYLCSLIPCIIAMIALNIIDIHDRKSNIEQYVASYQQKTDLLYNLLKTIFSIDSKEKVLSLINKYKDIVNCHSESEKKMVQIYSLAFTSFMGIVTATLANLKDMGINTWVNFICWIFLIIFIVSILFFFYSYIINNFNIKKEKYQNIINDLEFVLISKY